MRDSIDDVLDSLEGFSGNSGIIGTGKSHITDLFVVHGTNGHIFTIKSDGRVEVNPALTTGQAVDEFWKFLSTQTNMIQIAVNQARQEEREAIAKQIEDQGAQWGIMRSLKATNYANAAKDLADLIRK